MERFSEQELADLVIENHRYDKSVFINFQGNFVNHCSFRRVRGQGKPWKMLLTRK